MVLIFVVAGRSAKTAKICTPRKFPAIRYVHALCVVCVLVCGVCVGVWVCGCVGVGVGVCMYVCVCMNALHAVGGANVVS